MQNPLTKNNLYLIFLLFIALGVYLSFIGGYGSDEDTLAMIYVFQRIFYEGTFASSRFTGYPVAEIGIGFLSHFFGSWAANLITFLFLVSSLYLFYESLNLDKKSNKKELLIFIIICLSNPILYFDNIEPMDYSWALFFFSFGMFFLKKNIYEVAVLLFGISIGTRLNFGLFVIILLLFFNYPNKMVYLRKFYLIICSIFIGCLFYLPIWYYNSFSLEWVTAARPLEQGYLGLLARVIYKSFLAFGGLVFFYLIYQFITKLKIIKRDKNFYLCVFLSISNLLIFFWIPAELSYIQILLISTFYLLSKHINIFALVIIFFLNLSTWLIQIDLVEITHRYDDKCKPIQALSAKPKLVIKDGYFFKYLNTRDMIKCFVDENSPRGKKIINGEALK